MFWTLAAALLPALPLTAPASPPDSVTAFVNVSVIPMDREQVLAGRTVVVQGNRIIALGPAADVKVPTGARRVDGTGKFLIPGLADMHVHTDGDGPVAEYQLPNYLGLGITTVRNMGGSPAHLKLRERVTKGEVLGPRYYTTSPMIFSSAMPTPDAAKQVVARYKAAGYDFLKLYVHRDGEITRETFDTFVAATEREGLRFAGHAPLPPSASGPCSRATPPASST